MPRRRRSLLGLAHSPAPFGLGHRKPHHFTGMLRVAWENRRHPLYAWRVLTRGVCDGCALGTSGLRDWTIDGVHLCMVRLELLKLNTMDALDPERLADLADLEGRSSAELRELGRLGHPMRRRRGERGFTRVSWKELWEDVGRRWGAMPPQRTAMYVTSRGVTNEVYYTAQKVMRYLGTNNVDNSARLCHSPSTAALKSTLGVGATTCSYRDWYDADLIVFFGANPANDQPVTMKYLAEARRGGTRVLAVNACREPGMRRYWVPSTPTSALFGTRMTDEIFLVRVGGDIAFLNAVMKVLIGDGRVAGSFIRDHTSGFEELKADLDEQPLETLLEAAGTTREQVEAFAAGLAAADKAVFVWSMGLTQHRNGSDTVRSVINLGLLRGYVGRRGCGLMPIRGHSGVQGGAEMGAYATSFPGGVPVGPEGARRFSELWGFPVPAEPGLTTTGMLDAARRGELDAFYIVGGNFLETLPARERVREALETVPLRLHADIVLTSQMLVEPRDVVYLLPSRTRYEQPGGGTETTTERRVIYSPHIPGHDVGESRAEWRMMLELARAVKPDGCERLHLEDADSIRADIAKAVPFYRGIENLSRKGDQFQWGGERLCEGGRFPTSDGRAHFVPVRPARAEAPEEGGGRGFLLATRRGRQFNSMVQGLRDPLTGAERDHVMVAWEDAQRLGLGRGDPVRLRSPHGEFRGRAFPADIAPGTLQGHWPELNVLLPPGVEDPEGGVPDYNATVTLEVEPAPRARHG